MKHLLVITIISIAIAACSSGNQNTGEATTETAGDSTAVTPSGADTITQVQSTTESSGAFGNLRMGLTEQDVIALLGEPTVRETIGNDPKVPAEDWWYGDNQKVRMINKVVNHVVKDVARQKELFQQLMAAKKNNDEVEAKRIMDELTKDHQ